MADKLVDGTAAKSLVAVEGWTIVVVLVDSALPTAIRGSTISVVLVIGAEEIFIFRREEAGSGAVVFPDLVREDVATGTVVFPDLVREDVGRALVFLDLV